MIRSLPGHPSDILAVALIQLFPHHENGAAQASCAWLLANCGCTPGMLRVDGVSFELASTLKEVLDKHPAGTMELVLNRTIIAT